MKGLLKGSVPVVIGVLIAGVLMKLGADNDIPGLSHAADGYDR